jgi:ribosomal protein S18 acetylase RimI-like enzyme
VTRPPARTRRARPTDGSRLDRLQSVLPRQSPDLLEYGIAVGDVVVSTAEGSVVGYILPVYGDGVHVAELVVAPDHRREGRATELLDAVEESLGEDEEMTLAVAPENEGARSFYRTVGFDEVERRETYFDGDPALWLVKSV